MATEKRLIDANFLDDRCRHQMADEWNQRVAPVSWSEAYKEFLDDVWDAPIVDAVEVVHGRWIWISDDIVSCSQCNRNFYSEDDVNAGVTWYYCPKCGAKMDGDGNE